MAVTEMYYIIPIQVHLTEITSPHPGESCKSIVLIHYDILLPFKFPKFIVFPIFNFMIVDQNTSSTPGSNQHPAVTSCQTLLKQSPATSTGVYWIHTDGGSQANAFKAYCNMDFFFWNLCFYYKTQFYKTFLTMQDSLCYSTDGHTENLRPTHDPLGGNSPNQKKNVANPHANIFIRVE